MMKKFLTTLTLTTGISLLPIISHAQEYPGCFRINSIGKYINLNYICLQSSRDVSPTSLGTLQIPIKRRERGLPVIEATFNKQKTFDVLFDTGTNVTTLTDQMASELKLETVALLPWQTDENIEVTTGKLDSVRAGNVVVKDLVVTVSPSLSVGLLGQNFYAEYDVTIKEDVIELRVP